jgi:hypothetical protein
MKQGGRIEAMLEKREDGELTDQSLGSFPFLGVSRGEYI